MDSKVPYYAVIFTSIKHESAGAAYAQLAEEMEALVVQQPGYLGHQSFRNEEGLGWTISYWQDEAAILNWKRVSEHAAAQRLGRQQFYQYYKVEVARVDRVFSFGG